MKLNTYLNFAGNTEKAFNFYKSVFGGEFTSVVRFKDMPIKGVKIPKADETKIMHIGLPIGNIAEARLVLTDELVREALRRGKKEYAEQAAAAEAAD